MRCWRPIPRYSWRRRPDRPDDAPPGRSVQRIDTGEERIGNRPDCRWRARLYSRPLLRVQHAEGIQNCLRHRHTGRARICRRPDATVPAGAHGGRPLPPGGAGDSPRASERVSAPCRPTKTRAGNKPLLWLSSNVHASGRLSGFKSNLVILWEYYLSAIPPKNDTSFYLRIGYPKLGLFR